MRGESVPPRGATVFSMARDAALEAVFQPVRPPTTFEETVERLGTAIRLGLLAPGSKLPPERELASELRISRSTLREALTTLTQSGHLVAPARPQRRHVRRRGAAALAELERSSRSAQEAWAVLEHRVAIETGATILACERGRGSGPGTPGRARREDGRRRRLRGLPARRHPLPHRHRRGGALAAAGDRDDRGPGVDERPDRADRPSRAGADPLERAARGARAA